ncbi:MAG TPA: DJ-1/PfpI family protein [Cyclobacteriaceae bacterium]|nr:DJ-1/PfpI family protein [Cyclobacteriaceae bacterium]HMV09255.1 DJ-1/PfpI family protein [Cyclobacteriaceae bacterium]HMV91499.1 DJ-1/PfpI family protein [Cyclobacteriaceae bacterium]HMX01945.1 DJ-1/PfpI family protein [Cyclobacteriaceae bacterium]HMX51954.1 DJ-1/PfpI family protein [Cyclobacteriaceae bacterium]
MTKNVGILIFDDAEVLDFAGPFEVFSVTNQINAERPFNVFTISKSGGIVSAVNGLRVQPDYSIDNSPEIDILIISGGQGTRSLLGDRQLLDWVSRIYESAALTLSICSASRLMGTLGLLNDKYFCTHHEVYEHMAEIAPLALPQPEKRFTQSTDKLFTSGGISAGIDLSFHVISTLLGEAVAVRTAEYMEYNYIPQHATHEQAH